MTKEQPRAPRPMELKHGRRCLKCGECKKPADFPPESSGRCKNVCWTCAEKALRRRRASTRLRRCVDCRKPTANYRCEACWQLIRDQDHEWDDMTPAQFF